MSDHDQPAESVEMSRDDTERIATSKDLQRLSAKKPEADEQAIQEAKGPDGSSELVSIRDEDDVVGLDAVERQPDPDKRDKEPLTLLGDHIEKYIRLRLLAAIAFGIFALGTLVLVACLASAIVIPTEAMFRTITMPGVYLYLAHILGKAIAISVGLTIAYNILRAIERLMLPLVNNDVVDLRALQGTAEKKKSLGDVLSDTVTGPKYLEQLKTILQTKHQK